MSRSRMYCFFGSMAIISKVMGLNMTKIEQYVDQANELSKSNL